MIRSLLALVVVVHSNSVLAQTAPSPGEQIMEQCVTALEACESKAVRIDAQVKDLMQYKQVCDAEVASLKSGEVSELEKAFQFCTNLAELRQQRIDNLNEIEQTLSKDREQCYARLEETMKNYRSCVEESTKPWWRHALFYLGIVVGLAIGIPIGG